MGKILIVDDQKSVLLTLEALLKSDGHAVTPCVNAVEATRALAAEVFDLVITDAIMPGGSDGYTLVRAIRRHPVLAKMPVILLTGKREKSDVEKGIESGADDYIVKPIDPELLLAKIRKLIVSDSSEPVQFASAPVNFKGDWELKTEITTISELGLSIVSNIPLPLGKILKMQSPLFEAIQIPPIPLRIDSCEEVPGKEPLYRIQGHFVGVTEKELTPIRVWIRSKKVSSY